MTKEELKKEAKTECFMLTVNTIGIDQRDVELAYVMGAEPRENIIHTLDVLHKEAVRKYGEVNDKLTYAKTIIQDLLDNTDEYARQRAEDFLKENK